MKDVIRDHFYSMHQYPFYPGTGSANERGEGLGQETTMNRPLSAGTDGTQATDFFEEDLEKIHHQFEPDIILVSAGFDAHTQDPLGGLRFETETYARLTEILKEKAAQTRAKNLACFLEGGYNLQALAESVSLHLEKLLS